MTRPAPRGAPALAAAHRPGAPGTAGASTIPFDTPQSLHSARWGLADTAYMRSGLAELQYRRHAHHIPSYPKLPFPSATYSY